MPQLHYYDGSAQQAIGDIYAYDGNWGDRLRGYVYESGEWKPINYFLYGVCNGDYSRFKLDSGGGEVWYTDGGYGGYRGCSVSDQALLLTIDGYGDNVRIYDVSGSDGYDLDNYFASSGLSGVMCGDFNGNITGGGDWPDIWWGDGSNNRVVKWNNCTGTDYQDGSWNQEWTFSLDGDPEQIVVNENDICWAITESTLYKIDSSGNELWSKTLDCDGGGSPSVDVAVDENGWAYTAEGWEGATEYYGYLVARNSSGVKQWTHTGTTDRRTGTCAVGANYVYFCNAYHTFKVDRSNGNEEWDKNLNQTFNSCVEVDIDGNFYIWEDTELQKFNPAGTELWSYDTVQDQYYGHELAVDFGHIAAFPSYY